MTLSDEQISALWDKTLSDAGAGMGRIGKFSVSPVHDFARALLAKQDDSGSDSVACMAPGEASDMQWMGDVMILQVLADSDQVNEQERDVLERWISASAAPGSAGNDSPITNQPTALQSCPFCGGEAEAINCSVHCNNAFCEAQPFTAGQSQDEAIAAWNRRVHGGGELQVAVGLLREVVGPLVVSAAVIEDEDGGEAIEGLIDKLRQYVSDFERAALATPTVKQTPYGPAERMDVLMDAERGRFVVKHGGWRRAAGATYLTIRVADDADLSCVATRENALDAAMKEQP